MARIEGKEGRGVVMGGGEGKAGVDKVRKKFLNV